MELSSDLKAFVFACIDGVEQMEVLRFWKQSRDGLFLAFAVAFALLALDRIVLGLVPLATEFRLAVFLLRLVAFCLILLGILAKNRGRPF